ncbi:MAG: DEAD/DEAH box helicase family protein, partial [Victivallales bacterium]|nr:DEAD/DEAH box helicase family protein [Victivallales bacterium]
MITLDFQSGTILLQHDRGPEDAPLPEAIAPLCRFDKRVGAWRAMACDYAAVFAVLYREKLLLEDKARNYQRLELDFRPGKSMRDYQREALDAWVNAGRRGVVVLPTGSGKSFLAQNAIVSASRSTLVVVPTLDLLAQWALQLKHALNCEIGTLGGGSREIRDITVSTYDSAQMQMEHIGSRFGLLIVDECHHLPGQVYSQIAKLSIAPWRLGLTATPERQDGLHSTYASLLGDICYRREITDLTGKDVLAEYETIPIDTELDPDEQEDYNRFHARYIDFLHRNRINLGTPRGWSFFLQACARQPDGREALNAYLEQRRIARASRAKIRQLWELISAHHGDRIIVFTADNATAYRIGAAFALPVITQQTGTAERVAFLDGFRSGDYPVLVTSKVLNEGVDVPS